MPWAGSDAASASLAKCGWRREPGKRRTSAMAWMRYSSSRPRNSSSGRVEWPMVQIVAGLSGIASIDFVQRRALVHGDVVGLVALDLVLRIVLAAVAGVALVVGVAGVDLDDLAADVAGLGVPAHVVADLECMAHGCVSPDVTRTPLNDAARAGEVSALQDALGAAAEGGDQAGDDPLRRQVDVGEVADRLVACVEARVAGAQRRAAGLEVEAGGVAERPQVEERQALGDRADGLVDVGEHRHHRTARRDHPGVLR